MQKSIVQLTIILLIGAATTGASDTGDEIAQRSRKTGVCLVHHVRLVHATAYDIVVPSRTIVDLGNEQAALWDKSPNAIYPMYSLHRDSTHTRPIAVTYCPVCQRQYDRAARRVFRSAANASNQAMQLTAPRSVSPLCVATTFNLQPRALPGAVADLVSR
jgi:hypothetical protein